MTNPLLLDLPGSVPRLKSSLHAICREQTIDIGRASYLGMLRVKLLRSLNDCLALGARSECDSATADAADEDAAAFSSDTNRVQRTCCFGACQKKVINVRRHLERKHQVPVSKSGDLALLCSLLSKYKRPCDVPSKYAIHYMRAQ